MTDLRPWTFVLSEYLDLPFMLRKAGIAVVSTRSASEALDCLRHWCPSRVIIDLDSYGAEQVLDYVRNNCSATVIEAPDQAILNLLAAS